MNGKSILITGGTGSFGKAFTKFILKKYKKIKRLVIFSRDELKQSEMARTFSKEKYPSIRYFIGDVRDLDRISRALNKIDIVVHAAALKQVPVAEYNPIEFIKTNVVGAQNLIEACLNNKVKKVIALSTDKACAPINLYGATKLCSDKLFIAANNYSGKDCSFSIVRYGNVLGSRGSVLPILSKFKSSGVFGLTSDEMTRFSITLEQGVEVVDWSIKNLSSGDLVVPKIPSYHILDLVKAMKLKNKYKIVGIRKGEKIHEEMVTSADSYNTYDVGSYYIILADSNPSRVSNLKKKFKNCKRVKANFSYNSKDNPHFLNVNQLIRMAKSISN